MRVAAAITLPLTLIASPGISQDQLSSADRAAAFGAAGFKQVAGQWRACEAPADSIYTPGAIDEVRDLNGDGRPEAIITEGSTFCYGGDEVGFTLVSKQPDASWKVMLTMQGIATVLTTRGRDGWPDIEVGGQGFCFPVFRWNGSEYDVARFEYDGKPCKPEN